MRGDSGGPPRELYDARHAVWADDILYRRFLARHGLEDSMPVTERMGLASHPANRRNYASAGWGTHHGVVVAPGHADWNRLRQMGLIG